MDRAAEALRILLDYGSVDGAHHKMYAIDQAVRALTGDDYEATITAWRAGDDGPETYDWDTGVAP